MANPFLSGEMRDVETALLYEHAFQHNIGNAIAYTDGTRTFINTDENLEKLLPAYNTDMLKWLLWHEEYHKYLSHHARYTSYNKDREVPHNLPHNVVNIIMDILVHDSLAKLFPELVPIARLNFAQMRDMNSLMYTFKTNTLEEMLDEFYENNPSASSDPSTTSDKTKSSDVESEDTSSHDSDKTKTKTKTEQEGRTDAEWKLHQASVSDKEFISSNEGDELVDTINELKTTKIQIAHLTETLNGLVTSTRVRTYAMPSHISAGKGVILKGSTPGKAKLYLCFDASGSMCSTMTLFKEIISKSIPQALTTPTEWFSGRHETFDHDGNLRRDDSDLTYGGMYYKGTFEDFLQIHASSGYDDDGDRTIELCYKAEQLGYSPIGVTDGGGCLSWSKDMLKQLKRTTIVCNNGWWTRAVKSINPHINTICVKIK